LIDAERVDFIGVPVQDLKRADEFYGTTLGLQRSPHSGPRWVEYETGNVTIALISPEAMGPNFQPQPHSMPIALRVADVEEAKRKLEAAASSSARRSTPASATSPASPTRTATR
jgi:catechol-2,3-dioxygenase